MEHTKGPWVYRYLKDNGFIVETPNTGSMNDGKIADVMVRGDGESEANTKLIAAAPELLAACEFAADILRVWAKAHPTKLPLADALKQVEQAISKANGIPPELDGVL